LRDSRSGSGASNAVPQALQKRESAGFSAPQLAQVNMCGV
jgi:hypothetical protein